jgi:hypothetical protein
MIFTAQEHFPPVTQAEAQDLERLRYRWLTHASRLCDRRRRRGSDAPVVAFLDIWAIEYHKREGKCLQAQAAGACRVVDPVILPLHRLTGGGEGGGGGTGRRELECGPHSFLERYPVTRFDVDAERDAKGRVRRDVLGDHICAATTTSATPSTRHPEAEALDAGAPNNVDRDRYRSDKSALTLRELQIGTGICADADDFPRCSNERVDRQATRCRDSSGSRSSAAEDTFSGTQQCILGQICCRCRSTGDQIDDSASQGIGGEACDELSDQPADHDSVITLSREHPKRCQKYAYARNDATVCSDSSLQAVNREYDDSGSPNNTELHADKYRAAHPPQNKVSRPPAPDYEVPLGLDGVVEEIKAEQPRAVERRPSQKPINQVAAKIRELELKNAIPTPRHFRPAGHARHDNDNSTHRSQLYRDEKPNVDLIFPLHVRRFPRRNSDASPLRPETPLHHSIPEEEPYIHAPKPARSMPMLKDPPEYDSHPHAETEPLDTSRGNNDGFAVASGYGRRASKNFAVRRNSRP